MITQEFNSPAMLTSRDAFQVREREDDEIIEALNRYTLKLQNSLKVVNSTDM